MSVSQFRRSLYRAASAVGTADAARRGPKPLARRLVRKRLYRGNGTLMPRFFVGCYPEDRTPERDAAINRANDLFKSGV